MIRLDRGQRARFRFSFVTGGSFYDPLLEDPAIDIFAVVYRGANASGTVARSETSLINSSYRILNIEDLNYLPENRISSIFTFDVPHNLSIGDQVSVYGVGGGYDGEYEVLFVNSTISLTLGKTVLSSLNLSNFDSSKYYARAFKKNGKSAYFYRDAESEYSFYYSVPENLYPGIYTLVIQTTSNNRVQSLEFKFEVSSQSLIKNGSFNYFDIQDGIVTLRTLANHGLSVGDLVYLDDVNVFLNGNHYITKVNSENEFSISIGLAVANQSSSTLGYYEKINMIGVSEKLSGPTSGATISKRPIYSELEYYTTNSILLIGHSDTLPLNEIVKVSSIQEVTNLLGADTRSPLLRGVHDAHSCGAKNIYVMACASMSEYVDAVEQRTQPQPFLLSEVNNEPISFYQKYYERLSESYNVAKGYEFIDIVVPLETSLIQTGGVDFITQLAVYCHQFNDLTGYVQIGIIGSKTNGAKDSDIALLENDSVIKNKLTTFSSDGQISSDIGRFVIPVYGELNFAHIGFNASYASSAAAAFAGSMSSSPVYQGMIRKRLPGAYSVYGSNLSRESYARLDSLGVNAVYRSRKANRGNPYEVEVSNDYTLAYKKSSFTKAPQVRLVAMVINEIKGIANDGLGKNSEEKVSMQVRSILEILVNSRVIRAYDLQIYPSKTDKGILYIEISLVSSLGLKNINFSVTTGRAA
jgi:hypothetical protein